MQRGGGVGGVGRGSPLSSPPFPRGCHSGGAPSWGGLSPPAGVEPRQTVPPRGVGGGGTHCPHGGGTHNPPPSHPSPSVASERRGPRNPQRGGGGQGILCPPASPPTCAHPRAFPGWHVCARGAGACRGGGVRGGAGGGRRCQTFCSQHFPPALARRRRRGPAPGPVPTSPVGWDNPPHPNPPHTPHPRGVPDPSPPHTPPAPWPPPPVHPATHTHTHPAAPCARGRWSPCGAGSRCGQHRSPQPPAPLPAPLRPGGTGTGAGMSRPCQPGHPLRPHPAPPPAPVPAAPAPQPWPGARLPPTPGKAPTPELWPCGSPTPPPRARPVPGAPRGPVLPPPAERLRVPGAFPGSRARAGAGAVAGAGAPPGRAGGTGTPPAPSVGPRSRSTRYRGVWRPQWPRGGPASLTRWAGGSRGGRGAARRPWQSGPAWGPCRGGGKRVFREGRSKRVPGKGKHACPGVWGGTRVSRGEAEHACPGVDGEHACPGRGETRVSRSGEHACRGGGRNTRFPATRVAASSPEDSGGGREHPQGTEPTGTARGGGGDPR